MPQAPDDHDEEYDDEDDWDVIDPAVKAPPPPPPPPPPPAVGERCGRCSAVVPTGAGVCPGCLSPVGAPGRSAPRLAGGVLRLVFRGGGRHLDVPRGSEIRLGRSESWAPEAAGLMADEETVSARHATLVHTPDGAAWLTEVPRGASNGTRVNDRVLVPGSPVRLRDGDRVDLGPEVDFIVRGIEEEPGNAAP
ncbi:MULTISPECIES: FHA domain-containing protein [Streptomyces]|uniref:FHA domain-containing protein n=1 Tax=Streptomyces TaxID=1883 RepID=UPI002113F1F1|nr:FHA domain-containing protein [Streptomyces murinus]